MYDFQIRPYRTSDIERIVDLHNKVFAQHRTIEQWKWQSLEAPEGPSVVCVISTNDRIIGHFSVIPIRLRYKNTELISGKAEGAAVHPDFRYLIARKGLFPELVKLGVKTAFDRGIQLIWGLTSKPRDFLRTGFKTIGSVHAIQKEMSLELIIKRKFLRKFKKANTWTTNGPETTAKIQIPRQVQFGNPKHTANLNVEEIHSFEKEMADLWRYSQSPNGITIDRNREYLNWRFARNPFNKPTILTATKNGLFLGYLVVSTSTFDGMTRGYIIDHLIGSTDYEPVLTVLWNTALKYFKRRKVDYISSWKSENQSDQFLNSLLVNWGMGTTVKVIDFIVLHNKDRADENYVSDIQNWSLSMAFTEGRWG